MVETVQVSWYRLRKHRKNGCDDNRTSPATAVRAATVAQLARTARTTSDVDEIVALAKTIGVHVTRIPRKELLAGREGNTPSFLQQRALDRFLTISNLDSQRDHVVVGPHHTITIQLQDGNGLAFPVPDGGGFGVPRVIAAPIVYVLSAIAAVLIGVSLYAARFVTAPLSSFAQAAYAVGRNTNERKIEEKGPAEIVQVARALNEMGARISALLDERVGMLTAISHDLRTPLTRIRLRAERLVQSAPGGEGMLTDIACMEQILVETLTYMRDSTSEETVLPVDLPSVLETICVELADLGQNVTYAGPAKLVFRCQVGALPRAISNLVDNGLKYGSTVTVDLIEPNPETIQIDVSDDGPGIPSSLRARLRTLFQDRFGTNSQWQRGFWAWPCHRA